ncbi:fatty-acid--CoA ligase FadD5 [Pseudonocardia petroleophila]|uniref:AMP-binding protein n=1 Tax=Pseudonocardia petroleophila TaxID=37331 RepID=A0A7G7MBS6_9PSEU|nr:AMP-binding protein [Pseudonocardia petroleophila]MCX6463952.1 AMP-binding protein [Pseudonocardiales bacterium]QNG50237.1 AMP-binding protein [Pseudonocardia petroleophila]
MTAAGLGVGSQSFSVTVGELVAEQARSAPDQVALEEAGRTWSYRELDDRVARLAGVLLTYGVRHGDRVAVLAENRHEYLELELAAGRLGAITACLNWRLLPAELEHCIRLVEPSLVVVSPRFRPALAVVAHGVRHVVLLGDELDGLLAAAGPVAPGAAGRVDPEDGLTILYTSGTTGPPKGALISHRAMIARAGLFATVTGATCEDAFVAWAPMFHMASTDQSLITLMLGGRVVVCDGLDLDAITAALEHHRLSWLVAMPGMIEQLLGALTGEDGARPVRGVRLVGAMADLVPRRQIAALTALLDCPYANTFGSTECGLAPASANRIGVGAAPATLPKRQSPLGMVRLVDADDRDVPDGAPGELAFRGPTLFSGYWSAPQVNAEDFRGGWFHTGDCFVRQADGALDFVDRVKYMIKSGGENIYPAEIERHLLADERVADAVVVRRADERWGEVPVAVVARADGADPSAEDLLGRLRGLIAAYKIPRAVHFVDEADLPRSTTGKIQRHEVERRLSAAGPA